MEEETESEKPKDKRNSEQKEKDFWKIIEFRENFFEVHEKFTEGWCDFYQKRPEAAQLISEDHKLPKICNVIILEVTSTLYPSNNVFYILLLQEWTRLSIKITETVHIFGDFSPMSNSIQIRSLRSSDQNFSDISFLVLCPEEVLNVTDLTSKSDCLRQMALLKFFEKYETIN